MQLYVSGQLIIKVKFHHEASTYLFFEFNALKHAIEIIKNDRSKYVFRYFLRFCKYHPSNPKSMDKQLHHPRISKILSQDNPK